MLFMSLQTTHEGIFFILFNADQSRRRLASYECILILLCEGHVLPLSYDILAGQSMSVVLVVQWLGVGLVIETSLVRLPAGALSSQLRQLSLPSLRGR